MNIIFDVLINDCLIDVCSELDSDQYKQKYILSLINGFEDKSWRYKKFEDYIWDNIVQTALSDKERKDLIGRPGSTLREAAKNIKLSSRDNSGSGSEIAEIMLYGIMKDHYKALSIVPKIFYKQNRNDYAKGADSVHIVIEQNGFSLWFGEAKFYKSIDNKFLNTIVESVKNLLSSEKLKKENRLITNYSDIDTLIEDDGIKDRIKEVLSGDNSIDNIKPLINIPIFILYECDITKKEDTLTDDYKSKISTLHKEISCNYFQKQIKKIGSEIHLYEKIKFHIILFPIPEKQKIVDAFNDSVSKYRD